MEAGRRQVAAAERIRLRQDLLSRLRRCALHSTRGREGRLWRHRSRAGTTLRGFPGPSTSPLVFLTWLRRAGLKRFDAYAHHPYYSSRFERPTTVPRSKKEVKLGNIGVLIKRLDSLYGGRKRLWITEYGYQTRPPDRLFGVRYATQARYVHQAFAVARKTRRIEMLVWFLIRDEPRLSGWQSGVVSARDAEAGLPRVPEAALDPPTTNGPPRRGV